MSYTDPTSVLHKYVIFHIIMKAACYILSKTYTKSPLINKLYWVFDNGLESRKFTGWVGV